MIEKYFYDVTQDFNQLNRVIERSRFSLLYAIESRGGYWEQEQGCRLRAPFFRDVARPLFETFALSFCIALFKSWWTNLEPKAWSKSYVFQKNAKICAKWGPSTTL